MTQTPKRYLGLALQISPSVRWLTKGHVSLSLFDIKVAGETKVSLRLHLPPMALNCERIYVTVAASWHKARTNADVSTYQITDAKMPRPHTSLVLVLAEQGCVGLLALTLRSVLQAARNLSHSLHIRLFPPGGPGTGRGRLTNCKGFNWAAHKLFSLHKGTGSNKCHKPIMR